MQVSAPDRDQLRSLAELRLDRPVVLSLYLNLDPSQFATPPARKTSVRSLLDEAERRLREGNGLSHDDKMALQASLERAGSFLENDLPSDGAHGLAVFASDPNDLFEVLKLPRSVPNRVAIGRSPLVGPLARLARRERWCVALVNRRDARIFRGSPDGLREVQQIHDDVSGQHDQGGWSQARYQRGIEKEKDDHLKVTCDALLRHFKRQPFERLIVGGPREVATAARRLCSGSKRAGPGTGGGNPISKGPAMLKKLLFGAAAAGAIAWLAKNKDTAKAYVDRYAGQAKGAATSATPGMGREAAEERLNDPALARKVESEVFRDEELPKGNISVNAEFGVIYLRGEVPSQDAMDELTTRARSVDGVRAVENLTHLPGEPAKTS